MKQDSLRKAHRGNTKQQAHTNRGHTHYWLSVFVMKTFINLKTGVCSVIRKLLQHKLVLVHEIAIDWSINNWIKVWFTVVDCLRFCLVLRVNFKVVLELFWVVYFWSTNDQSVTILMYVCLFVLRWTVLPPSFHWLQQSPRFHRFPTPLNSHSSQRSILRRVRHRSYALSATWHSPHSQSRQTGSRQTGL